MASPKHFLDLSAVGPQDLRTILDDARARKVATKAGTAEKPLAGKMLAMIFEKPSTRTRVSFDVGMRQLGGETLSCRALKCSSVVRKRSAIPPRCCRVMWMPS